MYRNDSIDIYSNSWGYNDSFVIPLSKLFGMALHNGVAKVSQGMHAIDINLTFHIIFLLVQGRNGLGSIYVFATGNGGKTGDCCAANGIINSIYTIGVGSAAINGTQSFYDENCTGKLIVAYVDDPDDDNHGQVGIIL